MLRRRDGELGGRRRLAAGDLTHDDKGERAPEAATVDRRRLPGPLRDDRRFGATFSTFHDLVVAAPKLALALPATFLVEEATVLVGGTARFVASSGRSTDPHPRLLQERQADGAPPADHRPAWHGRGRGAHHREGPRRLRRDTVAGRRPSVRALGAHRLRAVGQQGSSRSAFRRFATS